jgi:hypothetical protein
MRRRFHAQQNLIASPAHATNGARDTSARTLHSGCSIPLRRKRGFIVAAAFCCGRSSLHGCCIILLRIILNRHPCSVSYLRHKHSDVSSMCRTRVAMLVLDEKMLATSDQRTELVRATDASCPPCGPSSSAARTPAVRGPDLGRPQPGPSRPNRGPSARCGSPGCASGLRFLPARAVPADARARAVIRPVNNYLEGSGYSQPNSDLKA